MEAKIIIGISAGILTAVSALPQIIKVLREKKAKDVEPLMFFVLLAGNGMWVWYGLIIHELPIVFTNGFSVLADITMLFLNYRYSKR